MLRARWLPSVALIAPQDIICIELQYSDSSDLLGDFGWQVRPCRTIIGAVFPNACRQPRHHDR